MKNNTAQNIYPIILIGTGLNEMYTQLDRYLKKTVSLTAGIEESNMRASLNLRRNISKNTLRKLATGLDVFPVVFFVPSKNIKSEQLRYKIEEGVSRFNTLDDFLELINISQDFEEQNEESFQLNNQIFCALNILFDKIQSTKKNKLIENSLKQKIYKALIDITNSIIE
jgi:transcriptional regulator with XRE-family HTH domain